MLCFSVATPPSQALKKPKTSSHHGIDIIDDYAWFKVDDWQDVLKDPSKLDCDVRALLENENQYCQHVLSRTEDAQKIFVQEMRARIKEDDSSVPMKDGAWCYGMRYCQGGQHPSFYRYASDNPDKHTLMLDGDALADGHDFYKLYHSQHAPDHRYLSWSFDDQGSEFYTLRIRDLSVMADLSDVIQHTSGSSVWALDSLSLFYVKLDSNHRPCQVYLHFIGTDQKDDLLIYEEKDQGFFVSIEASLCKKWILIHCHDHETSETHLIDARNPTRAPRCFLDRKKGHEYSLHPHEDEVFILTNHQQQHDFAIMKASFDACDIKEWQPFIPHRQGRFIEDLCVLKEYCIRVERVNGLQCIVMHSFKDNKEHRVTFKEEAYALHLRPGYEFDADHFRYHYSSMTTPRCVYQYFFNTHQRSLLKKQEIPSGHIESDYITKRIMAIARDGEEIPVSLLYHKETKLDGNAPCLLYGYGAYGINIDASFNGSVLSIVDRGFIYVIAHIRGGKDKGFHWYEKGKGAYKKNSFYDFIDVARHLIHENITYKSGIVAHGGSAGGMLMGALANLSDGEFASIIAEVPFVDVLNTMLDASLPLTPPEWPEWGNPIENKDDFDLIASYSPYDNIEKKDYPPILALAGLSDPRVTYWEPLKWITKLRDFKTNSHPCLLKTDMRSGHGGASGRFDRLKDRALIYVFACLTTHTDLERKHPSTLTIRKNSAA